MRAIPDLTYDICNKRVTAGPEPYTVNSQGSLDVLSHSMLMYSACWDIAISSQTDQTYELKKLA